MFHQSKYLQLIPLIISFQIMLCINHLLFNKIISSHRYKETVSFLNGQLAPLFQSAVIAAKKYKILLNSHLMTWLWHIKIFSGLKILLLGYRDILMHLKMFITLGLIHHFKCSSLFRHSLSLSLSLSEITNRVLLAPMKSISAIFGSFFTIRIFLFAIFPRPFLLWC